MIPADWTPAAGPAICDEDGYWTELDAEIAALDLSGALTLADLPDRSKP